MIERKIKILRAITPLLPEYFNRACEKIETYCNENSREIVNVFLAAMERVLGQVKRQQQEQQKADIKYIVFSHLFSGIVLGNGQIRIDVMDQGFYGDLTETADYLNFDCVYQWFEDDIDAIRNEIAIQVHRLREYEADWIWYVYMPYYHSAARALLTVIVNEVDWNIMLEGIACQPAVRVLFGGYMDQAAELMVIERGKD